MSVTIVHVGLPLDNPLIPMEERPKLTKRLRGLQENMRAASYGYDIVHVSPESGLEDLTHRLKRSRVTEC